MKRISVIATFLLSAAIVAGILLAHESRPSRASADGRTLSFGAQIQLEATAQASWGRAPFVPLAFPGAPGPSVEVSLPVLMYHHVREADAGDTKLTRGLTVAPAAFETQMIYLQQQGYQTVSMRQLFNALYLGEPLPPKPVLLTFDDGYSDNYEVAAPILEKYGFSGTFYIITGMVGNAGYMTWDQVKGLEDMGMEIGGHTATHPDLTQMEGVDLQGQLAGSAAAAAQQLGHPVYWLCYPSGAYDGDVVGHALAAGYLLAVTTDPGETCSSSQPLMLPRWRISPGTTLEEFAYLVG